MFLETRNNFSTCIHGIMSIDAQKLYTSVKKGLVINQIVTKHTIILTLFL